MSPLEHYRRAEDLLAKAANRAERFGGYDPKNMGILAHAQVHATLATVQEQVTTK